MSRRERAPEPLGIVLIHGAAVVMEGRALIFLGPSGTGKSTISQLLAPFAPVISDDRLYLIPRGPQWFVADATFPALERALTEAEARNLAGVPLGAVLRLFQSSRPSMVRVDALQTCRYLSAAFYEFFWARDFDVSLQKAVFSEIADVSRKTSGFTLYFDKSPAVIDVIRDGTGRCRQAVKPRMTM